jgi:hypothetical protein
MALNGINLMCLYGFVVCTRVVFKLFIVIDDLVLLNARERFLHTSSVSENKISISASARPLRLSDSSVTSHFQTNFH